MEGPDHAHARNRRPDLDGEALPIAFADQVEGPEAVASVGRIRHEIEGPGLVETGWGHQELAEPLQEPPLRAPREVQPHGAVHAKDALVLPAMPGPAQAIEALPKPPPTAPASHVIQRGYGIGVLDEPGALSLALAGGVLPHGLPRAPHSRPVFL